MNNTLRRRDFIVRSTLLTLGSMMLGACFRKRKGKNSGPAEAPAQSDLSGGISKNLEMPRDLVMKLLDQKVDHYMQISNNCAQSSYLALTEQFEIKAEEILKALTPLPGIAERGETCGAVTGPLMVFGLIYGRGKSRLHDWDVYRDSLVPSGEFCSQFEDEFGSTMCHKIQNVTFGKSFQLSDPEDLRAFQEAGATAKCSSVVRKAVRMAAEIILNEQSASDDI